MTIRIDGTLLVKKINSRNGPFCIGELLTDIGEFKIKDSLIDQFDEGKYQGQFWISQIYAHSYFAFGKVIIEIRARLADVQINDEGALPSEVSKTQEVDPADEDKAVPLAVKPVKAIAKLRPLPVVPAISVADKPVDMPSLGASPVQSNTNTLVNREEDLELFGEELADMVCHGKPIKLDPTIDRLQFRLQIKRLGVLGYAFTSKTQTWTLADKPTSPS